MGNLEVKCIHCGSDEYVKKGFDSNDGSQLYKCKTCNKGFNHRAVEVLSMKDDILDYLSSDNACCDNPHLFMEHHLRDRFNISCRNCKSDTRIDLDDCKEMLDTKGMEEALRALSRECKKPKEESVDYRSISEEPTNIKEPTNEDLAGIVSDELIKENLRYMKQKQFHQDRNLKERKFLREYFRKDNIVEEIGNTIIDMLNDGFDLSVNNSDIPDISENKKVYGILQLSDLHFGEIIDSVFENSYDFDVASKRLKLFIDKSKRHFKAVGVTNITVALTGDLVNAFEKVDKKQNYQYNRAHAMMVGVHLLETVLLDLLKDFLITVVSVSGNESRIEDKEYSATRKSLTNNFDWLIQNFLENVFRDVKNIKFIDGRYDEKIITFFKDTPNQTNILLTHGNNISQSDYSKNIQNLVGRYRLQNLMVDYVLTGHYHCCSINSDMFARSSSLSGGNTYSNNTLNLYGRASQNIHLIWEDGNRDSIKIDLQKVDNQVGYKLNEKLIEGMVKKTVTMEDTVFHIN